MIMQLSLFMSFVLDHNIYPVLALKSVDEDLSEKREKKQDPQMIPCVSVMFGNEFIKMVSFREIVTLSIMSFFFHFQLC